MLRCVERAGAFALGRRHETLERLTQDLRIDRGFGPVSRIFAPTEAVVRKNRAVRFAERFVCEHTVATLLLQMGTREESAVEKWDSTKLSRSRRSGAQRGVERSEEKGLEHSPLVSPAVGNAA